MILNPGKNTSRDISVALVELPATPDGKLYGKRLIDVYSLFNYPSRSIDLLAAILRANGFKNVRTFNPLYNRKKRFRSQDLSDLTQYDVVGISCITRTAFQSYELADLLKQDRPDQTIIFGGPHVTALPEEALLHGDIVVKHEGDHTFPELMERLKSDIENPWLRDVPGIVYKDRRTGEVFETPKRAFLSSDDLDRLPFPVYPSDVRRKLSAHVMISSRGCPYGCDYCSVIQNFGRKYRSLPVNTRIAMLKHYLNQGIHPIFFGDDNFAANMNQTKQFLEEILRQGIKMPCWSAQVRVETARDNELLRLMKRTNCDRVFIGLESLNEQTLKSYCKKATVDDNVFAVNQYHKHRINIHGMFVLGSDFDDKSTIEQTLQFSKKLGFSSVQFMALTPLPGTPLSERYEEEGKTISKAWHLYDAIHVVTKPLKMSPFELQMALQKAHLSFYSYPQAIKWLFKGPDRIYNAFIRIKGRQMLNNVWKESAAHQYYLKRYETVKSEIECLYNDVIEKSKKAITGFEGSVTKKMELLRALLQEYKTRIQEQYDQKIPSARIFSEQAGFEITSRIENFVGKSLVKKQMIDR